MDAGVIELMIASKAEHNWFLSSECTAECLPSCELQPLLLHSMESIHYGSTNQRAALDP